MLPAQPACLKIEMPASAEPERKPKELTEGESVVDPEAAEHAVHVAGVAKAISPHHNLEGLCQNRHCVIIDAQQVRQWSFRFSTAKTRNFTIELKTC